MTAKDGLIKHKTTVNVEAPSDLSDLLDWMRRQLGDVVYRGYSAEAAYPSPRYSSGPPHFKQVPGGSSGSYRDGE